MSKTMGKWQVWQEQPATPLEMSNLELPRERSRPRVWVRVQLCLTTEMPFMWSYTWSVTATTGAERSQAAVYAEYLCSCGGGGGRTCARFYRPSRRSASQSRLSSRPSDRSRPGSERPTRPTRRQTRSTRRWSRRRRRELQEKEVHRERGILQPGHLQQWAAGLQNVLDGEVKESFNLWLEQFGVQAHQFLPQQQHVQIQAEMLSHHSPSRSPQSGTTLPMDGGGAQCGDDIDWECGGRRQWATFSARVEIPTIIGPERRLEMLTAVQWRQKLGFTDFRSDHVFLRGFAAKRMDEGVVQERNSWAWAAETDSIEEFIISSDGAAQLTMARRVASAGWGVVVFGISHDGAHRRLHARWRSVFDLRAICTSG